MIITTPESDTTDEAPRHGGESLARSQTTHGSGHGAHRRRKWSELVRRTFLAIQCEAYDDVRSRGLCAEGVYEVPLGAVHMAGDLTLTSIHLTRVYNDPSPDDGVRILVDRIWPRGLTKLAAKLDAWVKELAPGEPLRRWYGHDPERFDAFAQRYRQELEGRGAVIDELCESIDLRRRLTLLTATKDLNLSHPRVLRDYLEEHL